MSLMDSYCFHKVLPDVSIVSHILFQGFPMVKTPKKDLIAKSMARAVQMMEHPVRVRALNSFKALE